MSEKISVIIPVLNEADQIQECLLKLRTLREKNHEIIVVDGGSRDRTRETALVLSDCLVQHSKGRARQMRAGASLSTGDILLFLHVDTRLPVQADSMILEAVGQGNQWGYFPVRLTGKHPFFRLIELLMNIRTKMTGIITGDHAIFITRDLYNEIDGYDEIDLMEDITISRKLGCIEKPVRLPAKVISSSRRWETNGIIRTIFKMWKLRLAYYLGADTTSLAKQYD